MILLQPAQGDALPALFQAVQRGRRQAQDAGELRVGQRAAFLAEEGAELTLQHVAHEAILASRLFRLWNIFRLVRAQRVGAAAFSATGRRQRNYKAMESLRRIDGPAFEPMGTSLGRAGTRLGPRRTTLGRIRTVAPKEGTADRRVVS